MEWLYHIGVPESEIEDMAANSANTVPVMMPYIDAFFMPRAYGDRPKVVPDGAVNFAFLGQFAETPRDTIFTTEVLLALAILIILLALAMIPISRHQRSIRQSELDSKAETIYLAAQNRLSQLQASGRSDEYGKDRATALNNIPWDAEQDKYTTSTLYYVTSAAKSTDTSAAGSILPREQVEAELWDANWVI